MEQQRLRQKGMVILNMEKLRRMSMIHELELWKRHCIYRVPAYIKEHHPKAYEPQLVSIGPYHHGEPHLRAMEEHKHRAVQHLLRRSNKPLDDYRKALDDVVKQLMESYEQLDEVWEDKERFLDLMILDGCFLYEFLRGYSAPRGYDEIDPIFSFHGFLNICPYMVPDILMIENQLPLMVVERLLAVETDRMTDDNDNLTHNLVYKFLSHNSTFPQMPLGLHVLDVARKGITRGHVKRLAEQRLPAVPVKSATELSEAGVEFRRTKREGIKEIGFTNSILSIPVLSVDSSTESLFLNFIAFERLHPSAGRDVSSYISFMYGLMASEKDVGFLMSNKFIESSIGSEEAVSNVMDKIAKNVFFDPSSGLCEVRDSLNDYYMVSMKRWTRRLREWVRILKQVYFSNPWTFVSLIAAAFLLGLTAAQTIYTILSYYNSNKGGTNPTPSKP